MKKLVINSKGIAYLLFIYSYIYLFNANIIILQMFMDIIKEKFSFNKPKLILIKVT